MSHVINHSDSSFDPFDPESLRISEATTFGVEKVLTVVPVTKPNSHVFVRTHPDEGYRLDVAIFEDRAMRGESYLVAPQLREELASDLLPTRLITSITRHGDLFLWPVRLVGADGRSNPWHESAAAASAIAVDSWVRVSANLLAGRYDVTRATGNLPEPAWPDIEFREILRLAFGNRYINDSDHSVLRALRGEI